MNKIIKICAVVLVVALVGSAGMAQSCGGGYYGGGHYRGGHHGGGHYGYYHHGGEDLFLGLLGLSIFAAALADQPVYVQQPVPLVYREAPWGVYDVEQPWSVYRPPLPMPAPVVYVPQPAPAMVPQPLPAVVTVNVTNSNGSYMPVPLRQAGPMWVGPGGEYYNQLPTAEQLRPVYGF
jgi:hypothetical protein